MAVSWDRLFEMPMVVAMLDKKSFTFAKLCVGKNDSPRVPFDCQNS